MGGGGWWRVRVSLRVRMCGGDGRWRWAEAMGGGDGQECVWARVHSGNRIVPEDRDDMRHGVHHVELPWFGIVYGTRAT